MAKIASDQMFDGYYAIGAGEARGWLARVQPACYSGWENRKWPNYRQSALKAAAILPTCQKGGSVLCWSDAGRLVNLARGIDTRPVVPHSWAKSISLKPPLAKIV